MSDLHLALAYLGLVVGLIAVALGLLRPGPDRPDDPFGEVVDRRRGRRLLDDEEEPPG